MPNYGWRKQSICIFDSDRRFELRRIPVIRIRDIEIRMFKQTKIPGHGAIPQSSVSMCWPWQNAPLSLGGGLLQSRVRVMLAVVAHVCGQDVQPPHADHPPSTVRMERGLSDKKTHFTLVYWCQYASIDGRIRFST